MTIYFRQIQHLLPRTKTWALPFGSTIRKFFNGIADGLSEPARDFIDGVWAEIFPETTNELVEWEQELGCWGGGTDAERRLALAAEWQATGGQSPRYLQDIIQAAGFDVYYHGWWDPVGEVVRDPHDYTESANSGTEQCHGTKDSIQDQCADVDTDDPPRCDFFLANTIYYIVNESLNRMAPPPLPDDEDLYRNFIYFGGEEFGTYALVPEERLIELRRLMLKISPGNMWIVSLVTPGPAAFGNCVAWWNLGATPYEVSYDLGVGQRLTNGGFESGYTGWTDVSSPLKSLETSDPYEGAQNLRIAYDGTTNPGVYQGHAGAGVTLYLTAGLRNVDATASRLVDGGAGLIASVAGVSWEPISVVWTAVANTLVVQTQASAAGSAEHDAVSLFECPHATKFENLANVGVNQLVQATTGYAGVTAPVWGGAGGLTAGLTDETDDFWTADGLASVFTGIDAEWSIGLSFQVADTPTVKTILGCGNSGNDQPTIRFYSDGVNFSVQKRDDAAVNKAVVVAARDGDRHYIVIVNHGTTVDVWLDGVRVVTAGDVDVGACTLDQCTVGAHRRVGLMHFAGCPYRDLLVYDEAISDANAVNLNIWLAARSPLS